MIVHDKRIDASRFATDSLTV